MKAQNEFNDIHEFVSQDGFPCLGARAANAKKQLISVSAGNLRSADNDVQVLEALYSFINEYRGLQGHFYSFVVTYDIEGIENEEDFEDALWAKLQSLHNLDSKLYGWDNRVSCDPSSTQFSFSLGGEAFFIIGLNPFSNRRSRRYTQPALVFNMHSQFEAMKKENTFTPLRDSIRKKDEVFCGSPNSMLQDHGNETEAKQYSGRVLPKNWQCPFSTRN